MNETVSSKFSTLFWFSIAVLTIGCFGFLIYLINFFIDRLALGDVVRLIEIGLLSIAISCYYFYHTNYWLKSVDATPEGIQVKYFLTKKHMVIKYEDILHVSSLEVINRSRSSFEYVDHRKLAIELANGHKFTFTDFEVSNYDELKEAIRRFRFHLN